MNKKLISSLMVLILSLLLTSCITQKDAEMQSVVSGHLGKNSFREDNDYNMPMKKPGKNINLQEYVTSSQNDIPPEKSSEDIESASAEPSSEDSDILKAKIRVGGRGTEKGDDGKDVYTLDSVTADSYRDTGDGKWELVDYKVEQVYYFTDKALRDDIYDRGTPLTELEVEYSTDDKDRRWVGDRPGTSGDPAPEKDDGTKTAAIRVGGRGTEKGDDGEDIYTIESVTADSYKDLGNGKWEKIDYRIEETYYTKDKKLRDEIYDLGTPVSEIHIHYREDDGKKFIISLAKED